jgi:uncharacterized linocin/CFP29 family protein
MPGASLIDRAAMSGLGANSFELWEEHDWHPGALRPFRVVDPDTRRTVGKFVTVPKRRRNGDVVLNQETGEPVLENVPVHNAPAPMIREDWLRIDETVAFLAKNLLPMWNDLYGTVPYNLPDGFGTAAIQHNVADGNAAATIGMEPTRQAERSRPLVDTAITPVPCIWSDGSFTARQVAIARRSRLPIDQTQLRYAIRACAELVDSLVLGTASSFSYAGGTIYGYINHPLRFTKTVTTPTGSNNATVLLEITQMVQTLLDNNFRGPFVVYYSNSYAQWLNLDYNVTYPSQSLISRLRQIPDVAAFRRVQNLSGYQLIVVQMDPDNVEGVQGMPLTPIQWQEEGGMLQAYKLLGIQFPRLRSRYDGKLGIVHGS